MRAISFAVGLGIAGAAILTAAPEHRNRDLKAQACARDGISPKECPAYEADHKIPLFFEHYFRVDLDILSNIQLQDWNEAKRKDEVEKQIYWAIRRGRMTPEAGWVVFSEHKGGW